ncbi:hypothetical protein A3A60_01800 [Candidatus Curtissbacteria bacterium RIFCSPLOWO2_01_FULL_42_26]|uniref:Tr-type G domain-containing protein n=1 Tax=Candidatus Curtissbacteria bacterium RIFCSPLOWO2_01_FULL_42_26 TaxID=1797729 RepID=A0A1F5I1G6_9BACT|nr:MAG: hypothetical protein A3A60_01800 [Candidatus Curtissbacteria bacterium RIFCSPLOWO2_01_FULL_42_26]
MDTKNKQNIRAPIVTIMGHVDHGKTTLLDVIRKTNVVAREHGGITQHIGAYQITHKSSLITFIDTPGHAAFEKMRSRGADVADIVVLVVAANDSVKPQTVEAIKHIKGTGKTIIIAITKIDLPNINIEKVKSDLKANDVLVEDYGGQIPVVEISAPQKKGVDDLLEIINLVWQMNPKPNLENEPLEAIVIESYLDKNRGPTVSAVVKRGTLKVGQKISVDGEVITVKALVDDTGTNLKEAKPSKPTSILGFKKTLDVGSIIYDSIKTQQTKTATTADHAQLIARALEVKGKFNVIIKADVLGSLEAIQTNLPEKIKVILSGVGEVQASDVAFAKIAKAPILAFNVKTAPAVLLLTEREHVLIRNYNVIYELVKDLEEISETFQKAKQEAKIRGAAKIIATFTLDGKKIAGVRVTSGKLKIGDQVIVKNEQGAEISSKITSLKKYKKDVESAVAGQECGVGFDQDIDFREGFIIESLG